MSICFTICPSVSLLLLLFKNRSSRHDGATHIVFTSHALLHASDSVYLSSLFPLFACCCPVAHLRPSLFWGSYVRFPSGLTLSFAFCLSISHLITVHINTNRHDITFAFLSLPTFPRLHVAFVFVDPCSAARGRCTLIVIA